MLVKELLSEVVESLDTSDYQYDIDESTSTVFKTVAYFPDDRIVDFIARLGERFIESENRYIKVWDVSFLTDDGYQITNDHKALQTLSFVKRSIKDLVVKKRPETMIFNSMKRHAAVYQKLLTRESPTGYKLFTKVEGDGTVMFALTQLSNVDVLESFQTNNGQ